MKNQVLILAAGKGQRFAEAGFTEPKLLLKLRSKPILSYNLDTLLDRGYSPVVVGSPAVCRWLRVSGYEGGVRIVQVNHLQPSPVHSALLAAGYMDPDVPVWLLDGDQIYTPGALDRIVSLQANECAVVSIHSGINPSRCDVVVTSLGVRLEEKAGKSEITVAGGYYFPTWKSFHNAAVQVLAAANEDPYTESRISGVVNYLCADRCREVRIEENEWISAGTPEELVAAELALR